MNFRSLLLVGVCLALSTASAQTVRFASSDDVLDDGEVHIADNVQYYEVHGRTERDILNGMMRHGPVWNGERYFGLTRTDVRYTYWKTPYATRCDLTDIQVYLEVTTTLPRWQARAGIPYQLERAWRTFDYSLRRHEQGHKQLAIEEAEMIKRTLAGLRTSSCDQIDAQARSQSSRIRATYQNMHEEYDRRTGHGRTQGATWPVRTR